MAQQYEIYSAVPVKPELIRFVVEVYEDEVVVSDYEIVLHTNEFTSMQVKDGVVEMKIDLGELQDKLSEAIAKMTTTAGVASAIVSQGLRWNVETREVAIPDGMQVAHGEGE